MKQFLAVYTGSEASRQRSGWDALPEDERRRREQAGMDAWQAWGARNAAAIVSQGGPLGRTKRVSKDGIGDIRNAMAAFTIVRAESHEAAARLFEGHPHFTIFPGDGVEVMEILPIPGEG